MFIQVRLLNGFKKSLTYKVPDSLANQQLVGLIVHVPLRTQLVHALVTEQTAVLTHTPEFAIKELDALSTVPLDQNYWPFITNLARHYRVDPIVLLGRMHALLSSQPALRYEFASQIHSGRAQAVTGGDICKETYNFCPNHTLTQEQQRVYEAIKPDIGAQKFQPTLIHGVTGSGKTEIYVKLILDAFAHRQTTIFMVPEVTLAVQFQQILRAQLPESLPILGFHCACGAAQKKELWSALITQTPLVIVGVHLPILLPIGNLGLIIIDEEHEVGYQEKSHPKINSKEAALLRAHAQQIPIVLGSATPSLHALYNIHTRHWRLCELTQRFAGAFAQMQCVPILSMARQHRKNFWITRELEHAITACLERKEQTLIFLNRRGFCFFIQCEHCTHVITCPNCSVSLTLHEDDTLRCHYCSHTKPVPKNCPACQKTEFKKRGVGTQHMVKILQKIYPTARIARADLDATVNKKVWNKIVQDFYAGELDILVGTQTITKGYHFPRVTLVGIIWADLNLNFPVYNASETTLQQLVQVAGRAGRVRPDSTVIVQTIATHKIFEFVHERDYHQFYTHELELRQQLAYPPCGRFAEIEVVNKSEERVIHDALVLAQALVRTKPAHVTVLGPALPPVAKIKNSHRRKIYIKAPNFGLIHQALDSLHDLHVRSTWYFNPNPL